MRCEIVEVGPRDGLQNEEAILTVDQKIRLLSSLHQAGLRRIEVTSFAHPRLVPQLADAEEVLSELGRPAGLSRIGLVMNERGMERAVASGVDEVNYVVVATDTFSVRNQGKPTHAVMDEWLRASVTARTHGISTSVTIAAAFGCPFEGDVPLARVLGVIDTVLEGRPNEITLADTIGSGVPDQVVQLVSETASRTEQVRCHFHNTRNMGYANAFAALSAGAVALDASVGGFGGCPFSPSATGNIATEDLVAALNRSGVETGVEPGALVPIAEWLESVLEKPYSGLYGRASGFPGY